MSISLSTSHTASLQPYCTIDPASHNYCKVPSECPPLPQRAVKWIIDGGLGGGQIHGKGVGGMGELYTKISNSKVGQLKLASLEIDPQVKTNTRQKINAVLVHLIGSGMQLMS